MPEIAKTEYRLYALSITRKNVTFAASERFARITPYYILLFTEAKKPEGAIELIDEEAQRLSEEDRRWLVDCGVIILAERIKEHEPEILKSLSERIEELEAELKRRKEESSQRGE